MSYLSIKKRFLLSHAHSHSLQGLKYVPHSSNPSEYMVLGVGIVTDINAAIKDGNIVIAETYTDESGNTYNVTRINEKAFFENNTVKRVEIPESITEIAWAAFEGCENLKTLNFHDNCSAVLSLGCFYRCKALEMVTIPASITEVGDSVFRECQSLKKVVLNGAVGTRMFLSCQNLKEVYIGDDITTLSERAFAYCSKLDTVRMGKNVEHIAIQVFYETSLKEIDFSQHTLVPTLENAYAFKGIERIIVPEILYEEWIVADEWSRLASRIIKASEVAQ